MKKLFTSTIIAVLAMALFAGTTLAHNPIDSDIPRETTPPQIFVLDWNTEAAYWRERGDGAVVKKGDSYFAMFMVAVETEVGHFITVEFSSREAYRVPVEVSFFPEDIPSYKDSYGVLLDALNERYGLDTRLALAIVSEDSELWSFVGMEAQRIYFGSKEHNTSEYLNNMYFYGCLSCEDKFLHMWTAKTDWQTWLEAMDDWSEQEPYDHRYQ